MRTPNGAPNYFCFDERGSKTLSKQGVAIKSAIEAAGGGAGLDAHLPFPICKKPFHPFTSKGLPRFGCHYHHALRLAALTEAKGKKRGPPSPLTQFKREFVLLKEIRLFAHDATLSKS